MLVKSRMPGNVPRNVPQVWNMILYYWSAGMLLGRILARAGWYLFQLFPGRVWSWRPFPRSGFYAVTRIQRAERSPVPAWAVLCQLPSVFGTFLCTLTVLVNVPLSLTQSENLPKPLPPFAFHVTFASQRTWTRLRSLFTWCLFKLCFSKCHCSWLCVSDFLSSVTSTDLKWGSRAWTLCRSTFWICKTLVNNINCFVMCWLKVKIKDLLL